VGRDDPPVHRLTIVLGLASTVAVTAIVAAPTPVGAHGVAGVTPTNYETRVNASRPEAEGIEVRSIDLGERLELRNRTNHDVLVLGYEEEPYLRVGPDGVFENRASPSWQANRTRDGEVPDGEVPDGDTGGDREPRWVRVGSGDTVSWHDHRSHWMGIVDPPSVRENSGREQRVLSFEIQLESDGDRIVVPGEVVWVPPPSPWPWLVGALGLAVGVALLSRVRPWPLILTLALVVLVGFAVAHVVGGWGATTSATSTRLAASVYSIAGIAVGVGALVWLARARDPYDATPSVLVSALFLAVAGGLADLTVLTRSQVPTTLPPTLVRVGVMVALGVGAGLAVGAGLRIRRPAPPSVVGR